ncbi:hypothetical protein [Flavobacterium collinsii]|uniref:Lipocalin-like domain-containing protein n=1 Tax=Flavobacterium collinsii TaxID=1114861 RepID=A0ABM8KNQ5_9FLAO|nr:hypothetical protein [Flavobacterium collinsii]CAA9202225.1 hypothetical protein FLACOL7796_04162 [Flavobacterium collinsii]
MKKNIRKIGILMITFSLMACTKEVDVLEPKLAGSYKIKSIITDLPVDLDNDGVANTDMSKEKDRGYCRFDDTFSFNNGKGIWADGFDICSNALEPSDDYFNYIFDKTKKTISMEIFPDKGQKEPERLELTDVFVSYRDGKQALKFSFYDERYTNRIVTYYLESE